VDEMDKPVEWPETDLEPLPEDPLPTGWPDLGIVTGARPCKGLGFSRWPSGAELPPIC